MSFILDALRKSDQQRQRQHGAAPTLLAVQEAAVESKRPALLAYGLLALVLVGAGVVIGLLRPWQPEQAARDVAVPVVATPPASTAREPAPMPSEMAPQPKPETALPTTQAVPAQPNMAPPPKSQRRPKTATQSAQSEQAPQPEPNPSARTSPQTEGPSPEAAAATADAASGETVSMEDLPLSIRQELPAMAITVHAYSDRPEARLVGINYRPLHEGDSVVPGLKLEQITPDGMIFSYKGYRFRRGMK